MYKILIFLHKTDSDFVEYFKNTFLPILSEISQGEVKLAKVESNILLDQKYSHFCEITSNSKQEMDEKLSSASGRKLGKLLMESHSKISMINISYEY